MSYFLRLKLLRTYLMDLSEEIIKATLTTFFGIMGTLMTAAIGAVIVMWSDVRALKKGQNAAFSKIRTLESKVTIEEDDIPI